jgi:hypothetical protein
MIRNLQKDILSIYRLASYNMVCTKSPIMKEGMGVLMELIKREGLFLGDLRHDQHCPMHYYTEEEIVDSSALSELLQAIHMILYNHYLTDQQNIIIKEMIDTIYSCKIKIQTEALLKFS